MVKLLKASGADISGSKKNDFGLSGNKYQLSDHQAQAILDLRLQRLTGLEQESLKEEYAEILDQIKKLQEILSDKNKLISVIKKELNLSLIHI